MWKYYAKDEGRYELFNLDGVCENCGKPLMAVNSVGSTDSPTKFKRLGMKEWTDPIPSEIHMNFDNDTAYCCDCYGKFCGE